MIAKALRYNHKFKQWLWFSIICFIGFLGLSLFIYVSKLLALYN